jgi:hypothetical protein
MLSARSEVLLLSITVAGGLISIFLIIFLLVSEAVHRSSKDSILVRIVLPDIIGFLALGFVAWYFSRMKIGSSSSLVYSIRKFET